MTDDQASSLRTQVLAGKPPAARGRRLRCIAIGSGKGGVGKTMVSVGLSYGLVSAGFRVLLVDADLGLANVDLQIGVDPQFTLQDVVFGKCSLEQAVLSVNGGPDVLAAASGSAELVDMGSARRQMFVDQLVKFAAAYDFLIIDVGAGIGQSVTAFLCAVPEVLVVLANEPTSLMDAYALIKTMAKSPAPPLMMAVINEVRSMDEGIQLAERLNIITGRFLKLELPLAGIIPYDAAVGDAIRARQSIVKYAPNSLPSCALRDLAETLTSGRSYMRVGMQSPQSMFNRLMDFGRESKDKTAP